MATSNIAVTEGSGKNIATNSITEDAQTKQLQRIVLNDSTGAEMTAVFGAVTETAPASDTASSGLNGRLQRIAQRITSLIGLFPTSIGQKAKAAALAVTLASDEDLLGNLGATTETAPASDTATSGLNGRLQRIAQRLSSLIALLPTAVGPNGGLKTESVMERDSPTNYVSGVTAAMTGTTSTSLLAAPGVSKYNYITTITVSNSHATVGTDVELQDGSGGTTIWVIPAAAVYGGGVVSFNPPLKQPTSNTALYVKNTTTGASTRVSANGYKGA